LVGAVHALRKAPIAPDLRALGIARRVIGSDLITTAGRASVPLFTYLIATVENEVHSRRSVIAS
jgi:hypothetical protein